jgi:phytoene desaturase
MKKAVVIGSGFGGLGIGIRLQASGYQVTILEKNEMPGGKAWQMKKDGYTFDMGPSLITAPEILDKLFATAGKKVEDYLEVQPLDPFYKIYFHDGSHLNYNGDPEFMRAEIARLAPEDAKNYDRFMRDAEQIYKAVIEDGLGSSPFMDVKTMLNFIPRALRLKALLPAYQFVKGYFKDPRIRFTFSFHPLFIGGNPFRAPAVYIMIPFLEKKGGVWYSKGGMYSLVQAMTKLFTDIGGELHTDSEVDEIAVNAGQATGVVSNGQHYEADVVVSNADFYHTYAQLIAPQHRRKWSDQKLKRLSYSMSAFLLYLGVNRQYPELEHHTLILSQRYRELVRDIFDKHVLPDDFSMYLHAPTRSDSSMAPEGKESLYVLIPVSNLQADVDWQEMATVYKDRVLAFLEEDFGLTDLRKNIEVEEILTPLDFASHQNAHLGSAWGVEPKFTQTAYFRPHNRSEDIKGLYVVGASTHPGAGVPGVLLTAETTEKVIHADARQDEAKSA